MAVNKGGRPKKGASIQEKLDQYLKEYDLDDMNTTNDMAALRQMCQLEVNMENLLKSISEIKKPSDSPQEYKALTTAYKDASRAWMDLQTELGINKKKRKSETDETPLSYIERLKKDAKKYMDRRLKKVICKDCGMLIAKYCVYVEEKGERGAIAYKDIELEKIKYSFKVECPKCFKMIEVSQE